ncbi:MAG: HAD-IC family P-type ATPase, partial [Calditrichia bacterium]
NIALNAYQKRKLNTIARLIKSNLTIHADVMRDGKWTTIQAKAIVPGDIVHLKVGDVVPADAKLIAGEYLECDESEISGDNVYVSKKVLDEVFSGSIVISGDMSAIVTATGTGTTYRRISEFQDEMERKGRFEISLNKISNYLLVIAIFLALLIIMVSMFRHMNMIEAIRFVALLVAASVPVALSAIATLALTFNAIGLAKKDLVIKKLSALERLSEIDILYANKSSTLTQNTLTIGEALPGPAFTRTEVYLYSLLSCYQDNHDPVEEAILRKTNSISRVVQESEKYNINYILPFNENLMRSEAEGTNEKGEYIRITKGAPQTIFQLLPDKNDYLSKYLQIVEEYGKMGYSMLALAIKTNSTEWQLIGLLPVFNLLREEGRKEIETAKSHGVSIRLLSDDSSSLIKYISKKLGMGVNRLSGNSFYRIAAHELNEKVEQTTSFSELSPGIKYSIINIMQYTKHTVGIIGKKAGDIPALLRADSSIAACNAAEAVKYVSMISVLKCGLTPIIKAIDQSRQLFINVRNYSLYRIIETTRILSFITLSFLLFSFFPVTPLMLVLLILVNELPAIQMIREQTTDQSARPNDQNCRNVVGLGVLLGAIGVLSSFFLFYLGQNAFQLAAGKLQTFMFLNFAIAGQLTIFIARTKEIFWKTKINSRIWGPGFLTKIIIIFMAVYGWLMPSLGWGAALFVIGFSAAAFLLNEILKLYYYKIFHTKETTINYINNRR